MKWVGVVNITPDSFSDGGAYMELDDALRHTAQLIEAGADVIDVGAESTRPGSHSVPIEVQCQRLGPYLTAYPRHFTVPLSVDTTRYEVAQRALDAGASWINDTSMLRHAPTLPGLVARYQATLVLNHSRHDPINMQTPGILSTQPPSLIGWVKHDLLTAVEQATTQGLTRLVLDPGIGFGKTADQCLMLIQEIAQLVALPYPIMIGTSRKSWLATLTDDTSQDRLGGGIASVLWAATQGVAYARVHDVAAHACAMRLWQALHPPPLTDSV